MKRLFSLLLTAMIAVSVHAQFISFPSFGKNLKMCSAPELGLERLHVGDEGYVTFQVVNEGDSIYVGPVFLRIVERESSVQVLAAKKLKIKPGQTFSITTVFSTETMKPYTRYFVGFEYNENGHTVPMGFTEAKPLESFMLLPTIINDPGKYHRKTQQTEQFFINDQGRFELSEIVDTLPDYNAVVFYFNPNDKPEMWDETAPQLQAFCEENGIMFEEVSGNFDRVIVRNFDLSFSLETDITPYIDPVSSGMVMMRKNETAKAINFGSFEYMQMEIRRYFKIRSDFES